MREALKKFLGYFGKRKQRRGPSLLGMESKFHKDPIDPERIKKAVREAELEKNKLDRKGNNYGR